MLFPKEIIFNFLSIQVIPCLEKKCQKCLGKCTPPTFYWKGWFLSSYMSQILIHRNFLRKEILPECSSNVILMGICGRWMQVIVIECKKRRTLTMLNIKNVLWSIWDFTASQKKKITRALDFILFRFWYSFRCLFISRDSLQNYTNIFE